VRFSRFIILGVPFITSVIFPIIRMRSLLPLGGTFSEISRIITQLLSQEEQQMGMMTYMQMNQS